MWLIWSDKELVKCLRVWLKKSDLRNTKFRIRGITIVRQPNCWGALIGVTNLHGEALPVCSQFYRRLLRGTVNNFVWWRLTGSVAEVRRMYIPFQRARSQGGHIEWCVSIKTLNQQMWAQTETMRGLNTNWINEAQPDSNNIGKRKLFAELLSCV